MVSSDDGQGTGTTKAMLRERLGAFRLLEELGSGAMGTVYRAVDTDEDRTVALKVLHPHLLTRKGFFQRFQREAQAGQRVRHPNVVRTLDCSFHVTESQPFCVLVMEYVRGRTLRDLLSALGTVPESLVREIGRQVAAGLAAIHAAGLVHRDLKPENVLITDDHLVRIMDLGVARHMELSTALTREGQFAGSLLYAAPEQFRVGPGVGPAADLYALGVVLYELTAGVNPFRHDEPGAVMHAHLEVVAERLDRRMEEVSPFLSEMVATLLEKEPGARFESASELGGALQDWESSPWWVDRKRTVRERRERRVRAPVRRETALHGREADLALLRQAWDRAVQGEGMTVLVEGEAGIGKSRLVDALLADVDGRDATILYGSYAPTGGRGGISDALLAHFDKADLEEALHPYLGVTPSLVSALAAFLKHDSPPEGSPSLQGDTLHTVLVHLMRGLGEERPLVWVIEDLHFADADSRKLILSLARAVEGHRVLLLLTTRPELPEEELAHLGWLENLVRTRLGRLGAREVISLLQDAFRSQALAEKLGGKIAFKSDGVPFFVFEMIRGLREGQFITQLPDGSWVESKVIEEIEVPATVRDLIGIRLKGLTKEERAILDVGAVQGFEFDPDLVARALVRPPVAVLQDAAEIQRRSGVLRAAGHNVRFDHHQIQEVLYEGLLPALREEYHALLARAYAEREGALDAGADELPGHTAVFLAEHGLRGREPAEGVPFLEPALAHYERGFLNDQAIALADRALGVPGLLLGARRLGILLLKERRLGSLGRREVQARVLEESLALAAGDPASLVRVNARMGHLMLVTARVPEAREHFERALTLACRVEDLRAEAKCHECLSGALCVQGDHVKAEEHAARALALAQETGDQDAEMSARGCMGHVLLKRGLYRDAAPHLEAALGMARATGNQAFESFMQCQLGFVRFDQGEHAEVLKLLELSLASVRRQGIRRGEASVTAEIARVHGELGQHAEARVALLRSLAIAREVGDRQGEVMALGLLSIGSADQGRYADAIAQLRQILRISQETHIVSDRAKALHGLGEILCELGQYEQACTLSSEVLELISAPESSLVRLGARGVLARAVWRLGQPERAVGLYRETLKHCGDAGASFRRMITLVEFGELQAERGHAREASDLLAEAECVAAKVGTPAAILLVQFQASRLSEHGKDLDGEAYAQVEHRIPAVGRLDARFLLWKTTRGSGHLAEAKRLLDHLVEHAPEEYRESMLKNVRLNREIMAAWAEHGEKAVGEGDGE